MCEENEEIKVIVIAEDDETEKKKKVKLEKGEIKVKLDEENE